MQGAGILVTGRKVRRQVTLVCVLWQQSASVMDVLARVMWFGFQRSERPRWNDQWMGLGRWVEVPCGLQRMCIWIAWDLKHISKKVSCSHAPVACWRSLLWMLSAPECTLLQVNIMESTWGIHSAKSLPLASRVLFFSFPHWIAILSPPAVFTAQKEIEIFESAFLTSHL